MSAFNTNYFDKKGASISIRREQVKIKGKCKWPIFRYTFLNPIVNTESGLKTRNAQLKRSAFYTFQQIITGNESIYLTPKGAISLVQHRGTGKMVTDADGKHIDGSYYNVKVDKDNTEVIYASKSSVGGGMTFNDTTLGGFGEFTSIENSTSIKFKSLREVSFDMLTDFYYIPNAAMIAENSKHGIFDQEYDDNDIYYIDEYTNYYDEITGKFIYSEITFSNIKDNVSTSGQVIEQRFQLNSPGGGYLIPKLNLDSNGVPLSGKKGWDWNPIYIPDRGVKVIQGEFTGNYALGSILMYGYPVDKNHNTLADKRIYAPRLLFIQNFEQPLTDAFYKVNAKSNTFVIADVIFQATADFPGLQAMWHDVAGDKVLDYQGILLTNYQLATATNMSNSTAGIVVNDETWGIPEDFFTKSSATSPAVVEAGKTDMTMTSTEANQLFYDGQTKKGDDGVGNKYIDLSKIKKAQASNGVSAVQLMNIMSMVEITMNELPFETATKFTWSLKDLPGFGHFLNAVTLGLPLYWRQIYTGTSKIYPQLQTLPMMIERNFYEFAATAIYASNTVGSNNGALGWWDLNGKIGAASTNAKQTWQSHGKGAQGKVPIFEFQKEESDIFGSLFGNKATSTAFTIRLTDKLVVEKFQKEWSGSMTNGKSPVSGTEKISTVMLGQDSPDGKFEYKASDQTYSIDADDKDPNLVTDVNGDTYVITGIGFRGIGDGDCRITCFKESFDNFQNNVDWHNYINFQTFIKTTAGYRNSQVREWLTYQNVSYLDALYNYLDKPFDWPKALPAPAPSQHLNDIEGSKEIGDWSGSTEINQAFKDDDWDQGSRINLDYYAKGNWGDTVSLGEILIHDFSKEGYSTLDDLKNDYKNVSLDLSNIMFYLKWRHKEQHPSAEEDYLEPVSEFGRGRYPDNGQNTYELNSIPIYKQGDFTNPLDSKYGNFAYLWPLFGNFAQGVYNNTIVQRDFTSVIEPNDNACTWFAFPYFDGVKLYVRIFYKGSFVNSSFEYHDRSQTNFDSLALYFGNSRANNLAEYPTPIPFDFDSSRNVWAFGFTKNQGFDTSVSFVARSYKPGNNNQ